MKGEVEPNVADSQSCWEATRTIHGGSMVVVGVVGGSRLERGSACEDGRSVRIGCLKECLAEVRAIIIWSAAVPAALEGG